MSSDLTENPGEITALLGPRARYRGKLFFEGRVRIDGDFEGSVQSEGMLIVGESARVHAEIDVGTLIVLGGELRGEIRAQQLVELHAAARVHGDIETPRIFVDRGAVFEGRCHMSDGAPSERHSLEGAIADALEGTRERSDEGGETQEAAARDGDEEQAGEGPDAEEPTGEAAPEEPSDEAAPEEPSDEADAEERADEEPDAPSAPTHEPGRRR